VQDFDAMQRAALTSISMATAAEASARLV
jgi:hypothetical protein